MVIKNYLMKSMDCAQVPSKLPIKILFLKVKTLKKLICKKNLFTQDNIAS